MRRFPKSCVLLLIAVVAASVLGNASILVHSQPLEPPAGGCHEHGSNAPSPQSTTFHCCLTGHNVAVLQASHSAEPLLRSIQAELVIAAPVTSPAARFEKTLISSGDPPGVTALRI
jgi:hypothetical protein